MGISPSQGVKLYDISRDLRILWEQGKLHVTKENLELVQSWIKSVLEAGDGGQAWHFIGSWNTKSADEAVSEILKGQIVIDK